jgi:hypothetical protein
MNPDLSIRPTAIITARTIYITENMRGERRRVK